MVSDGSLDASKLCWITGSVALGGADGPGSRPRIFQHLGWNRTAPGLRSRRSEWQFTRGTAVLGTAYLADSAVDQALEISAPRMDGTDHCYTHGGLKVGPTRTVSTKWNFLCPLCRGSSVNKDVGGADVSSCQGHHSDWDSKIFNYLKYEAGLGSVPRLQPISRCARGRSFVSCSPTSSGGLRMGNHSFCCVNTEITGSSW